MNKAKNVFIPEYMDLLWEWICYWVFIGVVVVRNGYFFTYKLCIVFGNDIDINQLMNGLFIVLAKLSMYELIIK